MYFSAGDQKEADETTGLVFFDLAQVNSLDNRYDETSGLVFFDLAQVNNLENRYVIHFCSKATL